MKSRERCFQPAIRKKDLLEINNGDGVRVANIATSKNLIVTKFSYQNIHTHICTYEGEKHNQINHVLRQKTVFRYS